MENITYKINNDDNYNLDDFTMDEIYRKDDEIETTEMQDVLDDIRTSHTKVDNEYIAELSDDSDTDDSKTDTIPEPSPETVVGEPVSENIVGEPVSENIVGEPVPEPIVEEPVIEPVPEPIVEEPVIEPVSEPIVEEPVPEPVPEPIVEPIIEPVSEPIVEEPVSEPIVEEPVSEPIVEEPVSEPIVEEPVSEPIVEEPVPEPVSEPIVEEPNVGEPTTQPISVEPLNFKPFLESISEIVPKIVFIIPYRDREDQYKFFSKHMKWILEDMNTDAYKILYIHQTDKRDFNRGALKNIGFLVIKKMYPNNYKDITLVFNDIDTMPLVKNIFDYDTTPGNIKHFYGFKFALGGILSIKASDFEKINGFPNFWAWGYEDNMLQKRAEKHKINIDRNQFYPIFDRNILLLHDGLSRTVNKKEFDRFNHSTTEGIDSIRELNYEIMENGFVNVTTFETGIAPAVLENRLFDLRSGPTPFTTKAKRHSIMKMVM